jgi:hypothetical protein
MERDARAGLPRHRGDARPLAPLFDESLTDTSVARGPDGAYYLTGTPVAGGRRAASARLTVWRSADRKTWAVARVVELTGKKGLSPEVHFRAGRAWLTVGFDGGGTGLIRFATADVAAAAWTMAVLTKDGADPSLFADDDGTL